MNFLILSITAGEGHNSTAKAIKSALEAIGDECSILDTYNYISPALAKIISEGYLVVTEKMKGTYKFGYSLAEKRPFESKLQDLFDKDTPAVPLKTVNLAFSSELEEYLESDTFDAIIYTHPFAGMLLDILKSKGKIQHHTVGILTDFAFHPYWENCTNNDYVIVPDRALIPQARRKGFADKQVLPLGIPINPKFSTSVEKAAAREKLGLAPDTSTLLIMGGSMGYGNIADTVATIDKTSFEKDFQMIVVCGNNADAKKSVSAYANSSKHKILVTGFVDYVSLLMDAADVIITKPGGLTTSESLAKGLPMIIVNPIPGQEERNTEFLLNNGCAMATSKTRSLEECIFQLLTSEVRLDAMRKCIAEIAKPNSTRDAANFIHDLGHTPII
ncbi:MAG: glycosyltransferase [Ruminococcaceae bacterium]|nr:glycosyltransferase [Oscillospiraceae bacterium]